MNEKPAYEILMDALVRIIEDAIYEIEDKHHSASERLYDAVSTAKKALKAVGYDKKKYVGRI